VATPRARQDRCLDAALLLGVKHPRVLTNDSV
jgi:hypothetical protein